MMFIAFKMDATNTVAATTPNTAAVRRAEARRMAKVADVLDVLATQLMPNIAVRQHPRLDFRRRLEAVIRRR